MLSCLPRVISRCVFYTCSLVLILAFTSRAEAEADWPQWRGPQRDDISAETGLLKSWPEGGPRRVWLYEESGLGYAGPAIVGDRMWLMGTRDDREVLLCLDANRGTELWMSDIGPIYENAWGDGPRSTPTVDNGRVYALGAQGTLICVEAETGQLVWSKSLPGDFDGKIPNWGYAESPLVLPNRLLCSPGSEDGGTVIALDRNTGEKIWISSPQTGAVHYSSIMLAKQGGEQIGVQLFDRELIGFSILDGEVHWSIPWPGSTAVVPTPIISGDLIYVTSGYGAGCKLIRLEGDRRAEEVYKNKRMVNHHGGVILFEGHVYGYSDGKGWVSQELTTGKFAWREKDALGKGAIAYADRRFYCLTEDSGEVALIDASPTKWKEHGRFTLEPQSSQRKPRGGIWVHPVIVDGRLYLRDQEYVYCYDVGGG